MEIGLSTLVWVLLALIVIKFWRNIVNLIGGLIWFGVFILVAIFIVTNFTTLDVDRFVDISFYDDLRRADEEYLVEKKDTAFDTAVGLKDNINTIGTEDDVFKDGSDSDSNSDSNVGSESTSGEGIASASNVQSIEESNLNFNDESRFGLENLDENETSGESESQENDKETVTESDEDESESEEQNEQPVEKDTGLVSYDEIDDYLESIGNNMKEDTKNLVRNLSPYVSWEYSDGDWNIESTSDGVIIEEN